ncbi:substrate-binding periplasmic protein [Andreprevotia chitinilytica]|uniref:substrate-binding periplasmic protein n=1 Tax=Andreprevotia chitinilytica TaxID=396808 RepID=UPI00054E25C4|nr:ABC transporter substrate-binding protein [Andreprevotia chitinilytica]
MRYITVLILLLTGIVRAEPTITLTLQEYPPFMGESLPDKGLMTSAVVAVFHHAGYLVVLQPTPNNRAIEAPRRGLVDGSFGWAKTSERERDLYFTEPVMALRMVFCQQKGLNHPWQTLTDVAHYRVGTTLGNFYSDEFDALVHAGTLKPDVAQSDEANLHKLALGRIDLFPIDAEVGPYLMSHTLTPEERSKLTCPDQAYWSAPLHVVISKKLADGAAIAAAFDKSLNSMRKTGELQRVIDTTRQKILSEAAHK